LDNAEAYNKLVIGYQNHAPVYLKDVATAEDSVQDERIDSAILGSPLKEIQPPRWCGCVPPGRH